MTRREQIEEICREQPRECAVCFIVGAEWADKNPSQELVNELSHKFSLDVVKQTASNLIEIEHLKKTILSLRDALTLSQETLNYIVNWEVNAAIYHPDDDEGYYYRFILHKLTEASMKAISLISEKSK